MFVYAKLHVHKTVIVGASLHRLIYNVLTDIVFPLFCHHLNLKNISQTYAQHKGFSHFNWTSTGGLKIDESRKLEQQKLQETYIAKSDFTF